MSEATSALKDKIQAAMIEAMRAQDRARLGVIRLIQHDIKTREISERVSEGQKISLNDSEITAILQKMIRQRRDSITQFETAKRQDLAEKELYEISVIQSFLPPSLAPEEIEKLAKAAIAEIGASSVKDISKVLGVLKPKLEGKADMGEVGNLVKTLLSK